MSVVYKTLRDEPAATYGRMDFATRDRYRHVVERLARRGKLDECDVARGALRLAREAAGEEGGDDIRAHVGWYLADAGVPQLERDLGLRRGPLASIRSGWRPTPLLAYVVPIRSEERRVGKALVRTCRSRWSPGH